MATDTLDYSNNYIYIYHLPNQNENNPDEGSWFILPVFPDSITDSLSSNFNPQNALSRTAPVFSYGYSGPRFLNISLDLHRDMMNDINIGRSNLKLDIGDDYVDTLIKALQTIVLPTYNSSQREVEPPMIAMRLGDEIFIKGVVNGNISVSYSKPILTNGKYAKVTVSFNVYETDPIDAPTVAQYGSFRYLTKTFKNGVYNVDE